MIVGERRRSAFMAGVAAAGIMEAADLAARAQAGAPSIPELAASLITSLLPAQAFGAVLVAFRYTARPLLLVSLVMALLCLGGGAAVALAPARYLSRPPRNAMGRLHPFASQPLLGGAAWAPVLTLSVAFSAASSLLLLPPSGLSVLGPNAAWLLLRNVLFIAICLRLTGERAKKQAAVGGISRRLFLEQFGLLASASVVGVAVFRGLTGLVRDYLSTTPTGRVGPFGDATPPVTPNSSFYVVSKNLLGDPEIGGDGWQLQVRGKRHLSLDRDQLLRMSDARQLQTLECISNEVGGDLIGTADWEGVRVASLLRLAGEDPGFRYVIFNAADNYSDSLPINVALDPSTIIALRMNGASLPPRHGFPARLLIPGRYGMKNVKWLNSIEAASDDQLGYWELRGWSRDAVAKTTSRFDLPAPGRVHAERPILLAGIAYAGRRGISGVQVRINDGNWVDARIDAALSEFTWSMWRFDWRPEWSGRHVLDVRAVDGVGRVQSKTPETPIPTGAAGYHRITVDA